jgi:hypothetical protein
MPDIISNEKSLTKEVLVKDGITCVISRDTKYEDAKLVFDTLEGIKAMFRNNRFALQLKDAFNSLIVISSQEERNYLNFGSNTLGTYRDAKDAITIDVVKCKKSRPLVNGYDNVISVLVHEIGHAIHLNFISNLSLHRFSNQASQSKEYYDDISNLFLQFIDRTKKIKDKLDFVEKNKQDQKYFSRLMRANEDSKEKYLLNNIRKLVLAVLKTKIEYDLDFEEFQDEFFETSGGFFGEDRLWSNTRYNISCHFINNTLSFSEFVYLLEQSRSYEKFVSKCNEIFSSGDFVGFFNEYENIRQQIDGLFDHENRYGEKEQQVLFDIENSSEVKSLDQKIKQSNTFQELADYTENLIKKIYFKNVNYRKLDYNEIDEVLKLIREDKIKKLLKGFDEILSMMPDGIKRDLLDKKQEYFTSGEVNSIEEVDAIVKAITDIFPSKYGTTNNKEDFAENFMFYILDRNSLSQWNINRLENTFMIARANNKKIFERKTIMSKLKENIYEAIIKESRKKSIDERVKEYCGEEKFKRLANLNEFLKAVAENYTIFTHIGIEIDRMSGDNISFGPKGPKGNIANGDPASIMMMIKSAFLNSCSLKFIDRENIDFCARQLGGRFLHRGGKTIHMWAVKNEDKHVSFNKLQDLFEDQVGECDSDDDINRIMEPFRLLIYQVPDIQPGSIKGEINPWVGKYFKLFVPSKGGSNAIKGWDEVYK